MNILAKKGLGILLPIIGGTSLIGLGFSVWVFLADADNNITLNNTKVAVTGLPTDGTWDFDAPDELVFVTNDDDLTDLTHCIEFYKKDNYDDEVLHNNISGTWTLSSDQASGGGVIDVLDRTQIQFKVSILDGNNNYDTDNKILDYFTFINPASHFFNTYIDVDSQNRNQNNNYAIDFSVDLYEMFQYASVEKKPIFLDRFKEIYSDLADKQNYVRFEFMAVLH